VLGAAIEVEVPDVLVMVGPSIKLVVLIGANQIVREASSAEFIVLDPEVVLLLVIRKRKVDLNRFRHNNLYVHPFYNPP